MIFAKTLKVVAGHPKFMRAARAVPYLLPQRITSRPAP